MHATGSDPNEGGAIKRFDFNPRDYTPEELEVLEAALKLMVAKRKEKEAGAAGLGGASAANEETGEAIEGEVLGNQKARR